jgi:hypothetical protein
VKQKSAVRSLIVVMVDVLVQHLPEVTPAANDQPVWIPDSPDPWPQLSHACAFAGADPIAPFLMFIPLVLLATSPGDNR